MNIQIRRAVKEDCQHLLELIDELAEYEKAPQEVTVTLEHFMESGFLCTRILRHLRFTGWLYPILNPYLKES